MRKAFFIAGLTSLLFPLGCAADETTPSAKPEAPAMAPSASTGTYITAQGMPRTVQKGLVSPLSPQLATDVAALKARNRALPVRWVRFPNPDQLRKYYPKSALKAGIRAAVLAECDWNSKGDVTDCRVLEETPQGYGFGEATRSLIMKTGRLGLKSDEAPFEAGQGIPVILRWEIY